MNRQEQHLGFRLARLVAALGVVSVVWACNAPSIPVPPPGETSFSSELVSDGMGGMKALWTARGGVNSLASGGRYYVFDLELNAGVIAGAMPDGSYVSPQFEGKLNDHVYVSYVTAKGETSLSRCLLLVEGAPAPGCPGN